MGRIYLGLEVDALTGGFFMKTIYKGTLALVKALQGGMHSALSKNGKDDDIELPHCSLPLAQSVDRLIKTPPEETPPKMVLMFPHKTSYRRQGAKPDHWF